MAIDGVSQSTGVERVLEVARADTGVLFVIRDRVGNVERERIILQADDLLAILEDRGVGRRTLTGRSAKPDEPRQLDVEVGRNEILLWTHESSNGEGDVAVGLDDFQDALEPLIASP